MAVAERRSRARPLLIIAVAIFDCMRPLLPRTSAQMGGIQTSENFVVQLLCVLFVMYRCCGSQICRAQLYMHVRRVQVWQHGIHINADLRRPLQRMNSTS